jgi:hypothetical protein
MALGKSRNYAKEWNVRVGGQPWYYHLGAHSLIHGGVIMFITNSLPWSLYISIFHFIFDFAKCEGMITIHQDQFLHVLTLLIITVWLII